MTAAPAVRRLTRLAARVEAPDADLLGKYVAGRDADAFAALVERHGAMVLGVCRRVAGDVHAAEDAYQATFLALARRAGTIRSAEALPAWLFGTALRVALRARGRLGRPSTAPLADAAASGPDPLDRLSARELLTILDDELARLPAKYRSAVVLCTLEGSTVEAAASHLGASPGAVRGWLQRGRERLRKRLERRGLTLSALVVLGAGVTPPPALAGVARSFALTSTAISPAVSGLLVRPWIASPITGLLLIAASVVGLGFALFPAQGAPPEKGLPAKEKAAPVERAAGPATDRFGDPLPAGALARLGTMRLRHAETIYSVAYSLDGKEIASGGMDGALHVWDAATGKERLRITDPFDLGGGVANFSGFDTVTVVAFSPDGRHLAAARINQAPALWDARTGVKLREFGGKIARSSWLRFSPDGKYLAFDEGAGRDGAALTVLLMDVETGKTAATFPDGTILFPAARDQFVHVPTRGPAVVRRLSDGTEVRQLDGDGAAEAVVSGDGRRLFVREKAGTVRGWDVATGKAVARFLWLGTNVSGIVPSPDGSTVLTIIHESSRFALWDTTTGKQRWEAKTDPKRDKISSAVFLPNGEILTGHVYGNVRAWDPATGKETRAVKPQSGNEVRMALSPDGKTLATAVNYQHDVAVTLTDTATFKPTLPDRGHAVAVRALAFAPAGNLVATGAWDETIRLWEPRTGKPMRTIPSPAMGAVAFTLDGKELFAAGWTDGKVRVYDPDTGKLVREWDAKTGVLRGLVVSPDGRTVVTAGSNVRAWTVDGKLVREFEAPRAPLRIAFSPDGETLAVASFDSQLRFYSYRTGAKRIEVPVKTEQIGAIAYSPDGKLLAWSNGRDGVHLADAATGRTVRTLPGRVDPLDFLAFAPDGKTLAWASTQNTREVRVWEVRTGLLRWKLLPFGGPAGRVGYSPDGSLLVTAGPDGSALVWDSLNRELSRESATPAQLAAWWDELAQPDAAKGYAAMNHLRSAGPAAVALIRDKVRPVPAADPDKLAAWVADLDRDAFKVRERASQELERLGESAAGALRQAVANGKTEEARTRTGRLLAAMEAGRLRDERAVEVLEMIGGADVAKVLADLAGGQPDAPRTRDAAGAAKRVGR